MEDRLARWLLDRLAEESGAQITDLSLVSLERPGAGQSSETILFTARWREGGHPRSADLVLRRRPGPDGPDPAAGAAAWACSTCPGRCSP